MGAIRKAIIAGALLLFMMPLRAASADGMSPHLVGWFNAFVPGGGKLLLGEYSFAAFQAVAESSTFFSGYTLSKRVPLTIDGVPEELPIFTKRNRVVHARIEKAVFADFLQEFGIKYHFVNTFEAYRQASYANNTAEGIDPSSTLQMFAAPFKFDNLSNPWVYIPLGVVSAFTLYDFLSSRGDLQRVQPLSASSSFLYALNYELSLPFGSGAPEEMFFRGFMQREFSSIFNSPFFAIPAQSVIFALAHEPGPGRYTALISGLYLGYLAHKYGGNLAPGITLHFWSVAVMGIEAILQAHDAGRTTPPTGFYFQFEY